ncbi:HAD family hydrolase [Caballeronia sp. ATUFL_M2_KS44]|uniref:HAD family hydrolase n=1 Tax=Caballeronia sp. ATUFL_M2_KS44 TaxID=2921767 RepID=UPI0020293D6E|nr:HAD family hydrolase [Caballeronia sp. ATUFL_M2_KS44]
MSDRNIPAADLMAAWSAKLDGRKIATFDCFDTIFWRGVAEPSDVYYALAEDPLFVAHRIGARVRAQAESLARTNRSFTDRTSEASLEEIYAQCAPGADELIVRELAEREVQKEIEIGFAFEPVLALMREAKARGLAVAIVSDTYYNEAQLRRILYATAPELETLIDHVFCSSAFGFGKSNGLWPKVMARLGMTPSDILHTGDNPVADYAVPASLGIGCIHLLQRDGEAAKAERQRLIAARLLFPAIRSTQAAPSLFHGMKAQQLSVEQSADERVGYWALGPIIYAFARFVLGEHRELNASGKPHKFAFLMRDGHLVRLACEAMSNESMGAPVYLSRFTAVAVSFDSAESIQRYLVKNAASHPLHVICDQMLMPPELKKKVLARATKSKHAAQEFCKLLSERATQKIIIQQSNALRARLFRHLQNTVGLARGDTLVLADLGYYGTIQHAIRDVFKRHFDVEVIGRYFASLDSPGSHLDRKALIDSSWTEENVVETLIAHIGDFEQMCAVNSGSVIAYEEDGTPILADVKKGSMQLDTTKVIQESCLRFIRDVEATPAIHLPELTPERLRVTAAIELARLVYLPEHEEITRSAKSLFELNVGTDIAFDVANVDAGIKGLRQRGPFYMRSIGKGFRTGYPSEMRYAGIDQAIFLMALRRHRLDFTVDDTSYRRLDVPALFVRGNESATQNVSARATYDGFYSVVLPRSQFDTALMIGRELSWMQLESATTFSAEYLDSNAEFDRQRTLEAGSEIILDGMEEREPGIYQVSPNGLIYLPAATEKTPQVVRLIFRPLAKAAVSQMPHAL